jgi:hypothetical protein
MSDYFHLNGLNSTGSVAGPVIQATALGGRILRMVWGRVTRVTLCRATHIT